MIRTCLLLLLLGGAAFFLLARNNEVTARESNQAVAAHAEPAVVDGPRIHLSSEQRREAAKAGGFSVEPASMLLVEEQMKYGDFVWNDEEVPPGPISIRVDLRTQILSVFRGGHEIGTAVVLYGADADEKKTPTGRFPILWKGRDHRSSIYDAPMPYTLRLTGDGIAIHGSDVRRGAATNGCVGIPIEFARHLFEEAKVGDPVLIVRTAAERRRLPS